MELFASAIPHFPPEKTPMGLPAPPTGHTPSSAMPSSSGLCERYGVYSNTSLSSQESGGSSGPLLSRAQSVGGNAARGVCVCVLGGCVCLYASSWPSITDSSLL